MLKLKLWIEIADVQHLIAIIQAADELKKLQLIVYAPNSAERGVGELIKIRLPSYMNVATVSLEPDHTIIEYLSREYVPTLEPRMHNSYENLLKFVDSSLKKDGMRS